MKKAIVLLLTIFSVSVFAEQKETFWQMVGRDMATPYTTPASKVLWPGLGLTAALYATKAQLSAPATRHVAEEKPLGSTSSFGNTMGQDVPNILYAGGMFGYYLYSDSPLARERAILMTKATLYSAAVTEVLKVSVREQRPNGSSDMASVPSGHATTAFSFAAVVGAEHAWYYGVGAYALAAFVGFSRMNDNMHYLHDVVAGATIGTVYGLGVYYRSIETGEHPKIEKNVYYVPVITPDVAYLDVVKEF